jgi:anti-sigma factor RsiW
MNHRPFEDWLLADEALDPERNRELRAHLLTCKTCAALAEVNVALRSAQTIHPVSGFTNRFQERLAVHKAGQRKRAFWGVLVLGLSALTVLVWLGLSAFPLLEQSPFELFVKWLGYMAYLITAIQAINVVSSVLWGMIPDFVPPAWLAAGGLVFAGLSSLWVIAFCKVDKVVEGAQT